MLIDIVLILQLDWLVFNSLFEAQIHPSRKLLSYRHTRDHLVDALGKCMLPGWAFHQLGWFKLLCVCDVDRVFLQFAPLRLKILIVLQIDEVHQDVFPATIAAKAGQLHLRA